eukprot:NODE_19_length_39463_cov_0.396073.p14 type:complete len:230 gc:universal NODE_19_length_39463_cov_0.396073:26392-27081(+)
MKLQQKYILVSYLMEIFIEAPRSQGWHSFPSHISVSEFQRKIELITGITSCNQKIDKLTNADPFKPLEDFIQNKQHIIVRGQLEFDEEVEKFEISNDHYSKLTGTVQSFLKQNKLGKYGANDSEYSENIESYPDIEVGKRCLVIVDDFQKTGTILYFGPFHLKPGKVFVGVEYDEPLGKHNGTIDNQYYFKCKPNYGALVKPSSVILTMPDGSAIPSPDELFEQELMEM